MTLLIWEALLCNFRLTPARQGRTRTSWLATAWAHLLLSVVRLFVCHLQVPSLVQLQLEDRQAVLEGLVRIVSHLDPKEAPDCALSLQQPLLARTQAILTFGSSTAAQGGAAAKQLLQHLAQELQLMAVLIKGMEVPAPMPPGTMHPAMKLLEAAWPALTAVAEAPVCQQDPEVVQALCEVYKVCTAGLVSVTTAAADALLAHKHGCSWFYVARL